MVQKQSISDRSKPGLEVVRPSVRSVHGATAAADPKQYRALQGAQWPPIPDLFDVITYFRARGDSFSLIANIGFRTNEEPARALTAKSLKLWYEAELDRRSGTPPRS
jgi:hypothetical protein